MEEENRRNSELPPIDEVDFSSGYERQYEKEYRPIKPYHVPPPQWMWYRDYKTICMVGFLVTVFLFGSVMLTTLVFTLNPWQVAVFTAIYVLVAAMLIYLEVQSIHVR